jgi:hypothetical protein
MSGNQVDQLLNDVGSYEGEYKEFTVILMDQCMKENGRMGKNMVKGH